MHDIETTATDTGSIPGFRRQTSQYPHRHWGGLWLWLLTLLTVLAWGIYLFATLTDRAYLLDHHTWLAWFLQGQIAWWLLLLVFFASWYLMMAAMMILPSLPVLAQVTPIITDNARRWTRPRRPMLLIGIVAFALPWTIFGLIAFMVDAALRVLTWQWTWTAERPWLMTVALLLLAGVYQLMSPKEQALHTCHKILTAPPLQCKQSRQSIVSAWRFGSRYGLVCLASDWALMSVMFGVGMADLPWLAGLTALMVVERLAPWGWRDIAALSGGVLLILATLMALAFIQVDGLSSSSAQGATSTQMQHIGNLTVTLSRSTVAYGSNSIRVVVLDATGTPLEGAVVSARADMVEMDMGTQIVLLTHVDGSSPGEYRGQVDISMPGRWELAVVIYPPHQQQQKQQTTAHFFIYAAPPAQYGSQHG